jgi:signal transduction histidine kinase
MDGGGKVNILLVDDQPARLLTYQTVLSELGQNLVSAQSGVEALEKLMRDEFAVVLLDVSMPDMDGFETARLIHDHPRFERTPIIFVTGVHVTELDRLKGYKLGAVDYVSIPVVPEILRGKVAVLVELYLKRRELRELNRHLAHTNERLAEANRSLQAEKSRELESLNATLQRANTELESANRRLQEADHNKDEFLAMLAHELRNPLAPILNAVQLMRMQLTDEQLRWAREVIGRQLAQLTRLVDDLLDVSRITRGKIVLAREPLELGTLIARAVETVHPLIQERGHALAVQLPEEAVTIDGDPLRLTQALGNVLANAAKYTGRGGRISLAAVRDREEVEIRVRDNGIGIAAERLGGIFELFTQSERGGAHSQGGLGIGLALVRRLVEMHGGSVSANSAGPGQGSEFVIRLPLLGSAARPGRQGSARAEEMTPRTSPVPRRILVADDNRDALESLTELLKLQGHEVFSAADGRMALECAERHLPEIALLDIGMPLLDGYEVARRIRAQSWGQHVTLLALTGWGQQADRQRSQEAGFDLHLVKPVDPEKLAQLLERFPARSPRGDPAQQRDLRR